MVAGSLSLSPSLSLSCLPLCPPTPLSLSSASLFLLLQLAPFMGAVSGALLYEFAFMQDFGLQNTLLAMYTRGRNPMPGYVDRFKRARQEKTVTPPRQSGADVELDDEI